MKPLGEGVLLDESTSARLKLLQAVPRQALLQTIVAKLRSNANACRVPKSQWYAAKRVS